MSKPSIVGLELRDFELASSASFSEYVSEAPQTQLQLTRFNIDGPWVPCDFQKGCSIEKLEVKSCDLVSEAYRGFLLQLSEMPRLKHITIDHWSSLKYTIVQETLGRLLRSNRIASITLKDGSEMKSLLQDIVNGLATNTSLGTLDMMTQENISIGNELASLVEVLKHHNTSLKEFNFARKNNDDKEVHAKVVYYTTLNLWGRGMARRVDTTLEGFVSLVCAVESDNDSASAATSTCIPERKLNIQYALLTECPGLWSDSRNTAGRNPARIKRPLASQKRSGTNPTKRKKGKKLNED
jgi:hypothetical protein